MQSLFNKYIKNFGCDWSNKHDVLKKVREDGLSLQYADYGLRDDFNIVMAAVLSNPYSLEFASRHLRKDKEIALASMEFDGSFLFIDEELKNNVQFAMKAFKATGSVLPCLYDNEEIWLEAMHSGEIFRKFAPASDRLKSNKHFMMKLISQHPLCFQYASEKLKDDEDLAMLAVKGWANQLDYASQRIKDLKKFQKIFLKLQTNYISEDYAKEQLEKIVSGKGLYS